MTNLRAYITLVMLFVDAPIMADEYIADSFGLVPRGEFESSKRSQWSGTRTLIVDSARVDDTTVSATELDTLEILSGPESIRAGAERLQTVVVAKDEFGNFVDDGTKVALSFGELENSILQSRNGLVHRFYTPPPIAGTFSIAAYSADRQSKSVDYRVVPDWQSTNVPALSGQEFITDNPVSIFRVENLRDQYDNPLGDGIAISFQLRDRNKVVGQSTSASVGSAAQAEFQTNALVGQISTTAIFADQRSAQLRSDLFRTTAPAPPKVSAELQGDIDAISLTIGPFLTNRNHLLGDGTPIKIVAEKSDKSPIVANSFVQDGFAHALLYAHDADLPIQMTIIAPTGKFSVQIERVDAPKDVENDTR